MNAQAAFGQTFLWFTMKKCAHILITYVVNKITKFKVSAKISVAMTEMQWAKYICFCACSEVE